MKKNNPLNNSFLVPFCLALSLAGCGAGPSESDEQLDEVIDEQGLDETDANTGLPAITDPVAQLGMKLFFSKSLGGQFDAACVSCHHPALGGADGLSLPVGVDATDPDQLGPGRSHQDGVPLVPRNSPTVFNIALWDTGLFWDSRVESIGKEAGANGSLSGIRTPDSDFAVADPNAGANLPAAQARFPVTSAEEMKGTLFEINGDGDSVRDHLAARIGDYGEGTGELLENQWLTEFQLAFATSEDAENLITFENIAFAIGEYERSMNFTSNPWSAYVAGDLTAITEDQKQGALLFFTSVDEGGAGCSTCHSGDLFSDGRHHTVAFPQIGPGKGDGENGDDDFGRERESGDAADRYRFRTPSLLNVAMTAPYGHSGAYQTLEEVVRHYINPRVSNDIFFASGGVCRLAQFRDIPDCDSLYPNAQNNTQLALQKLGQEINQGTSLLQPTRLDNTQVQQLVAFLEALTDPCVQDRDCLAPWIPDTTDTWPDGQQLNATDLAGDFL